MFILGSVNPTVQPGECSRPETKGIETRTPHRAVRRRERGVLPPRNEGGLKLPFADIMKPRADEMAKEYIEDRNGGYYVTGTGVSLDSVVQCFVDGLSPETILGEFEALNLAQVYGAITYYLENQGEIDAYRVRQKRRFEEMRRAAEPLPEGLRHRLDAAREELRSGRAE